MALKRSGGIAAKADGGRSLKDRRATQQAAMTLQMGKSKFGAMKQLDDKGIEQAAEPETIDALNEAFDVPPMPKQGNRLEGKDLDDWKANAARRKMARLRQSDTAYYTILVFDAGNQCQAFVRAIKERKLVPADGDLFIDGRIFALSMGITLPKPDYNMEVKFQLASGLVRDIKKVPKGYSKT